MAYAPALILGEVQDAIDILEVANKPGMDLKYI